MSGRRWTLLARPRALVSPLLIAAAMQLAGCGEPSSAPPVEGLSLSIVSGNGQSGAPGQELPAALVARVEDTKGRGVSGQIVNFRVVSGGGSVFAGAAITNKDGVAQERWTLGMSGQQRLEARAVNSETGQPLVFAQFSATIADLAAPLTSGVVATPTPVETSGAITVSAHVSDEGTGSSLIAAAEFNVNGGSYTAMTAQDGAFDETAEAVTASSAAPATPATYSVCVRGRDAAGNTSVPECTPLVVHAPPSAIYVSTSGSDINSGIASSPMRTIGAAISRAVATASNRVNIAEGTYVEQVTLATGISLYGGFNGSTWIRDPATFVSTIASATPGAAAVTGSGVSAVTLDGIRVEGSNATSAGASSYALILMQSNSVIIRASHFVAGNGAPGVAGTSPAPAASGGDGTRGQDGDPDGLFGLGGAAGTSVCSPSTRGGAGGNGGHHDLSDGFAGAAGLGPIPGLGGAGGRSGNPGDAGIFGGPGGNGSNGLDGTGGTNFGGVSLGSYTPAPGINGSPATQGSGGGGGGGGGGQGGALVDDGGGSGGGGGGAGGCAGAFATRGEGGGGSFAILLEQSANVIITASTIRTGGGGAGGAGGSGASGGLGGTGAFGGSAGSGEIGRGGHGGNGGSGGAGGSGGGGGGGPSIGILVMGGSATELGNTFVLGAGGVGGAGGLGAGSGVSGRQSQTFIAP